MTNPILIRIVNDDDKELRRYHGYHVPAKGDYVELTSSHLDRQTYLIHEVRWDVAESITANYGRYDLQSVTLTITP